MINTLKETDDGRILYNKNDMYIGKSIEKYGHYQLEEKKIFAQYVNKDSIVIDVGANIGTHTLWFANNCKFVWAFEPQRVIFQTLCANMALNDIQNVDCKNLGVGEKQELIKVPIPDYEVENNFGGFEIKNTEGGETVAICRIDDMMLPYCDFIKIDVEGMEAQVLMGALTTLTKCRPVLYVELDRMENKEKIIDILSEMGYLVTITAPPLYSKDYKGDNVYGEVVSINAVCTPMESEDKVSPLWEVKGDWSLRETPNKKVWDIPPYANGKKIIN